jgi:hypothetical protein
MQLYFSREVYFIQAYRLLILLLFMSLDACALDFFSMYISNNSIKQLSTGEGPQDPRLPRRRIGGAISKGGLSCYNMESLVVDYCG